MPHETDSRTDQERERDRELGEAMADMVKNAERAARANRNRPRSDEQGVTGHGRP